MTTCFERGRTETVFDQHAFDGLRAALREALVVSRFAFGVSVAINIDNAGRIAILIGVSGNFFQALLAFGQHVGVVVAVEFEQGGDVDVVLLHEFRRTTAVLLKARQGMGLFAQLAEFLTGRSTVHRLQGWPHAAVNDAEEADIALWQVVKLACTRFDVVGGVLPGIGRGQTLVVGAEFSIAVAARQQ